MVQRLEGGLGRVRRQFSGGREEPKRSPRGGQEEPKRCQEEPKRGQEEPKRRPRGAQEEPRGGQEEPRIAKVKSFLSAEADNTGPRARPTKTFVKHESWSFPGSLGTWYAGAEKLFLGPRKHTMS